ncbi:MAG TPA: xanthine dehydrogenase family protein molybdopterin-binding subunit [Candidatus Dormibacteraeota bacterium]|nr:xanthine dehydrogenase family protein molybdopterin-binding subunit [Candidatus Dormibacteraeota bacterium]
MGKADGGPIGRSLKRLEDERLLRGEGRFVDDLDASLHVAFVRSHLASGRINAIDTSAAREAPGVAGVFTAADLEGSCLPLVVHISTPGAVCPPRSILALDRVRFPGELIAAVVADSRYRAADAAELVEVDFDPLPAITTFGGAMAEDAPLVHEAVPGNLYHVGHRTFGEAASLFDGAEIVVEGEVVHPRVSAAPMETRGVIAKAERSGVVVWTSTQIPHLVADAVAECLKLEPSQVRVVATDVGGGFGIKAQAYPEEILLAWIARRLNASVRWIETRSEHMHSAGHARDQQVKFSAAVRDDGRVLGLRATVFSSIGAYGTRPFGPLLDPLTCAGLIPGPYDIRNYEYGSFALATNECPEGAYRGVGMVTAVLAHERLMDLIAARLRLDPADVRRVNFVTAAQMPYATATGHPYESGNYAGALDAALDAFGYVTAREQQKKARAEGRLLGIGIASYVEFTGAGSSTYRSRGMEDVPGTDTTRMWQDADGRVHLQTTSPAIGQGSNTTFAQVAAAALGVDPERVIVEQTDTAVVGHGTGSFMSRGSVATATSVFRAASLLRELAAENGDLDVSVTYDPVQAAHPYATHVCMVEVDRGTGAVAVLRYLVAEDCGVLINPMIVEGQVAGGVAQALGAALMEEITYGSDGELRSGTFLDYLIPSIGEMPALEIKHLVTPSTVHELGTKGVGEGGTIGGTAALANAIADALSISDVVLPLTPDRIVALLV